MLSDSSRVAKRLDQIWKGDGRVELEMKGDDPRFAKVWVALVDGDEEFHFGPGRFRFEVGEELKLVVRGFGGMRRDRRETESEYVTVTGEKSDRVVVEAGRTKGIAYGVKEDSW